MTNTELIEQILKKRETLTPFSKIAEELGISKSSAYTLWKQAQPQKPEEETVIKKKPLTLQYAIIERFLKGTELENFWENYKKHTKSQGGQNRQAILAQLIPKEDLELLKIYLTDFTTPLGEVVNTRGITVSYFYTKVMRVAVKVIAQNPNVLDKMLTSAV